MSLGEMALIAEYWLCTNRSKSKSWQSLCADCQKPLTTIFRSLTNPLDSKALQKYCCIAQIAIKSIKSAFVESHCAEYGCGVVRLMGRSAGFITLEASAASRDVNLCLIPEFPFQIYGEYGILKHIFARLNKSKHCVIGLLMN